MNDFIAIDVETANFEASSICAVGAVKVRGGEVVDSRYSLVCPEPEYYTRKCMEVHGITVEDTADAPSFGALWRKWQQWFEGLPFAAHNAAFDSRCIASACRIYQLDEPQQWYCTLQAARRSIPRGMCPSKSLDMLCEFFAIPLKHHHNALDDALACARLAIILL